MLTPEFRLEQSDGFVVVHIKAPYVKATNVDWYLDAHQFKFFVKPYFLRLTFEQELVEDGRETAQYDIETGWFKVQLPKATAGTLFTDLDLHTKLLARTQPKTRVPPSIEVISSTQDDEDEDAEAIDDGGFEWEVEQTIPEPSLLEASNSYGFDNKYSNCLTSLQHNGCAELTMLSDPDKASYTERLATRLATEQAGFDDDYYLAELFDAEDSILPLLQATKADNDDNDDKPSPHLSAASSWRCYSQACSQQGCYSSMCRRRRIDRTLSPAQQQQLASLPKRELLVSAASTSGLMLTALDLLLAYYHELRVCGGDLTPESSTTIAQVSSTLSVLLPFLSLEDVVLAFCRRSLCFSLHRHWLLTMMAIVDVIEVLRKGRRAVLVTFLALRDLFMRDEARAIMADIYLTDYCIWLQTCPDSAFESLAAVLTGFRVAKEDVDLNLPAYDEMRAAILAQEANGDDETNDSHDDDDDSDDDSDDDDSDDDSDDDDNDDRNDSNAISDTATTTATMPLELAEDASSLPASLLAKLKL